MQISTRGVELACLALLLCVASPCVGQDKTHHHTLTPYGTGKKLAAGSIDGSLTPDLIPDLTAYRLVFMAIAEPADATPDQIARQEGKLSPVGLSQSDLQAIFTTLAVFAQHRRDLDTQFKTPSLALTKEIFESQRDGITQTTMAALQASLSPDGMQRLRDFVKSEKRNMTVVPFPKMP